MHTEQKEGSDAERNGEGDKITRNWSLLKSSPELVAGQTRILRKGHTYLAYAYKVAKLGQHCARCFDSSLYAPQR
uniref:Uncharacterized protein n=1 Tax=Daucus carota subsp. sativus TaxID=79200 RepID=A0A166DFA8_DAUCS